MRMQKIGCCYTCTKKKRTKLLRNKMLWFSSTHDMVAPATGSADQLPSIPKYSCVIRSCWVPSLHCCLLSLVTVRNVHPALYRTRKLCHRHREFDSLCDLTRHYCLINPFFLLKHSMQRTLWSGLVCRFKINSLHICIWLNLCTEEIPKLIYARLQINLCYMMARLVWGSEQYIMRW